MKEYKPILITLIKFFSIYLFLTVIYYTYLNYYNTYLGYDPFTKIVATQSSDLLNHFNFNSSIHHHSNENYLRFYIGKDYTSIVNEGCNALSVIILYLSFIITFSSDWKKTIIYLLITLPILHIINIIRITFINYILYKDPKYAKEIHDYIFPSIIYGLVILLWIIWIKYSILNKINIDK